MEELVKVDELRGFLLGQLSETDRDALELAVLGDDALYETLRAVETELIDESIRGELSIGENESLQAYLGRFTEGRARFQRAKSLEAWRRKNAGQLRPATPTPGVVATLLAWFSLHSRGLNAAAIMLLAAAIAFLVEKNDHLVGSIDALRAQLATSARSELDADAYAYPRPEGYSSATEPRAENAVMPGQARSSVVLSAGVLRGEGETSTVSIARTHRIVELDLDLGLDEYPLYRAVLCDAEGKEILAANRLAARVTERQILVPFPVPTELLPPGDYYVYLQGISLSGETRTISRYDFRALLR